jgi:uncharacterized protein (DUF1697 family)
LATYIGLVRAINLAGRNVVAMSDLRDLMAALGLEDARTLLQSGNVVFRSSVASTSKIERLSLVFFVRSANEWARVIAANPFPDEAKNDPARLVTVVLKEAPERAAVAALQHAIKGREVARAKGREVFITYPDGQGRSKLTMALIERHLGTSGTARNWNTVLKLAAVAGET